MVSQATVEAFARDVLRGEAEARPADHVVAEFIETRLRRVLAFLAAGRQDAIAAEVPVSGEPPDDLAHDVGRCLWEDLGCEADVSALTRSLHADLLAEVRAKGTFGPGWATVTERAGRLVMTVAAVTSAEHLDCSGVETGVG